MKTTRDQLHQILELGDTIVYGTPRGFLLGEISGIEPSIVSIRYDAPNGKMTKDFTRASNKVIKINEQIQIAKDKNPEEYL